MNTRPIPQDILHNNWGYSGEGVHSIQHILRLVKVLTHFCKICNRAQKKRGSVPHPYQYNGQSTNILAMSYEAWSSGRTPFVKVPKPKNVGA